MKVISLVGTLLLMFSLVSGQEIKSASLTDEFGELCSDDLRGRIDALFAAISESPGSSGYVVGHAQASLPGRYEKFVRLFENQISFRNFYPDRIQFVRGTDRERLRIQFWLAPAGSTFSLEAPYIRSPILFPTLFDASAIDSMENGEVLFGGDFGAEPCDFGLQPEQFAKELILQPDLEGHLVATSDRRHSERFVRRALYLTKKQLTKTHGIRSSRIKVFYAGRVSVSEMQLWLVPKGTKRTRGFTTRIPG